MTQAFEVNEESFEHYSLTPPANADPPLNAGDRSGRKRTVCGMYGVLSVRRLPGGSRFERVAPKRTQIPGLVTTWPPRPAFAPSLELSVHRRFAGVVTDGQTHRHRIREPAQINP